MLSEEQADAVMAGDLVQVQTFPGTFITSNFSLPGK